MLEYRNLEARYGGLVALKDITFKVAPGERVCFAVAGAHGDAAVVNLTPVEADGPGNGQLVSSDVTQPPVASNVNRSCVRSRTAGFTLAISTVNVPSG